MQIPILPKLSRLLPIALLALPATWARAEVQIRTLDDGSRMIFNESQVEHSRRVSSQLLPVPKAELKLLIDRYARFFGVAPQLVQAVVQAESGYNPKALSSKGAMGLMQLMPGTAELLGVSNAWDPQQNVRGGSAYLRQQLDRFGDVALAVAAYHAGPGAVEKYKGVPPYADTQDYVVKVLALYQQSPPAELVELARDRAKAQQESVLRKKDELAKIAPPVGNKVFVTRDANNQLIFTNTQPVPTAKTSAKKAAPPNAPRRSASPSPGAQ